MRNFILLFILSLLPLNGAYSKATIAVLDFENNSIFKADEYQTLSQGLAEILISELDQYEGIEVVERRRLRNLLDELKLNQSGLMQENQSLHVGKMLGARFFLFGSYLVNLDDRIRIDVRIVEVETGLTIKSQDGMGKTKKVLKIVDEISRGLLNDLDIKTEQRRARQVKRANDIKMDALVLFSQGVEYEDQDELIKARDFYQKTLAIEPGFMQARQRLEGVEEKLRSDK